MLVVRRFLQACLVWMMVIPLSLVFAVKQIGLGLWGVADVVGAPLRRLQAAFLRGWPFLKKRLAAMKGTDQ